MESHPKSGTQINLENFGLKVTNAVEASLKESIGKIFTNTSKRLKDMLELEKNDDLES